MLSHHGDTFYKERTIIWKSSFPFLFTCFQIRKLFSEEGNLAHLAVHKRDGGWSKEEMRRRRSSQRKTQSHGKCMNFDCVWNKNAASREKKRKTWDTEQNRGKDTEEKEGETGEERGVKGEHDGASGGVLVGVCGYRECDDQEGGEGEIGVIVDHR